MQILKEKSNDYIQCNNWGSVLTKRAEFTKKHNRHFILYNLFMTKDYQIQMISNRWEKEFYRI